eukprot:COSAG02_NODE_8337_length_2609_cov_2.484462_2_plen_93_part_00
MFFDLLMGDSLSPFYRAGIGVTWPGEPSYKEHAPPAPDTGHIGVGMLCTSTTLTNCSARLPGPVSGEVISASTGVQTLLGGLGCVGARLIHR